MRSDPLLSAMLQNCFSGFIIEKSNKRKDRYSILVVQEKWEMAYLCLKEDGDVRRGTTAKSVGIIRPAKSFPARAALRISAKPVLNSPPQSRPRP